MAVKQDKSNASIIISVAGVFISLLTLLFGSNIINRFSGPKLILSSTKVQSKTNDKIKEYLKKSNASDLLVTVPNCIRVINIKNIGSTPSNNLNIDIKLDGKLCDYVIDGAETVKNSTTSDERLTLSLLRLSKDAELKIVVWLIDEKDVFQVNYADDKSSKTIEVTNNISYNSSNINIIMLAVLFISLGVLGKEMFTRMHMKLEDNSNKKMSEVVLNIINEVKKEQDEEKKEKEDEAAADEEDNLEKAKEELRKLINESKNV